jgi:hypothetical protein
VRRPKESVCLTGLHILLDIDRIWDGVLNGHWKLAVQDWGYRTNIGVSSRYCAQESLFLLEIVPEHMREEDARPEHFTYPRADISSAISWC